MMQKGISLLLLCFLLYAANAQTDSQWEPARDSLIQNDPGFGYMKDLDSLLHMANAEADSMRNLQARSNRVARSKTPSFLVSLFNNPAIKIAFWIVLAIFIGYVLIRLFQFRPFSRTRKQADVADESNEESLQEENWYDAQINAAEASGDYMLAIRFRFMKSLASLNEQGVILFTPEKTNAAYANEIRNPDLRKLFLQRSMIYEYVWYGKKQLSEEQYRSLIHIFEQKHQIER